VRLNRCISICFLMLMCLLFAAKDMHAQATTGAIRGQVMDPSGAAIPDATVLVIPPQGAAFTATTDREGLFEIKEIPAGTYKVQVMAQGFATFEKDGVVIASGHTVKLEVSLSIKQQEERVVVTDEAERVELSPENNASQLVLKGKDLEALSDDPDQLQSDLQALAGPAAGPNGGQIYIDGFTGGQLPPKSAIREIRINQNPFSSEYDHLGYGRIEIFTKPGTDKIHGEFFVDGNASAFNSRSPLEGSAAQPSYHSEFFHGDLGGPLDKSASYFVSVFHRSINDLSIINAETLDSNFQPVLFTQTVPNPRSRTNVSPRLDFQLGEKNTLTVRYQYYRDDETNNGIGQFNLASQGYNVTGTEHTVQVSDTQTLGESTINETRFQFRRYSEEQTPQSTVPTINVNGAFTGGGSNQGNNIDVQDSYEIQNYTSMSLGKHYLKFGARVRATKDTNAALSGFNGAFTFDSLTAYQITQQGLQSGMTPAQIRAAGGGASRFSITQGTASVENTYADLGIFAQDEWRALPSVTLSLGLRMESQNQINDHADFAPRFALAWGLGGGKKHQPQTVLRAGWGIFYDRFDQDLLLQAQRLNGVTQQQFIVTNPDFYPSLPTPAQLSGGATSPTIYQVDPWLTAPYTMQTGVSLERQLTKVANIAVTYLNSRGVHGLLTRNINAPLPPDYNPANRPLGGTGNIYQYESAGIYKQNQLIVNGSVRIGAALSLFGYYSLNYADSDTDGANSFPSNSYNIQQDYGRAAYDIRHRVFFGGTMGMPYGFRLSPFLVAMSGSPFNITLGQDLNNDSIFNDRPTYATLQTDATKIKVTPWGTFDLAPLPSEPVIPINLGTSPARFSLNMRLSKTFGFGAKKESAAGGPGGPNIGSFGRPVRGGHHGFWGMGSNDRKYSLTVGIFARNIFNNVNVNPPIGVLTSPLFGESNSLATGPFSSGAANRRIDLQMSFSF
jgi:hypothetical protein